MRPAGRTRIAEPKCVEQRMLVHSIRMEYPYLSYVTGLGWSASSSEDELCEENESSIGSLLNFCEFERFALLDKF